MEFSVYTLCTVLCAGVTMGAMEQASSREMIVEQTPPLKSKGYGAIMSLSDELVDGNPGVPNNLTGQFAVTAEGDVILPATSTPTGFFTLNSEDSDGNRVPVTVTKPVTANAVDAHSVTVVSGEGINAPRKVYVDTYDPPLPDRAYDGPPASELVATGARAVDVELANDNSDDGDLGGDVPNVAIGGIKGGGSVDNQRTLVPCVPCSNGVLNDQFIEDLRVADRVKNFLRNGGLECCVDTHWTASMTHALELNAPHLVGMSHYPIRVVGDLSKAQCREYGVSFWGRDLAWRASDSPEDCAAMCSGFGGCERFTYVEEENVCYLKPEGAEVGRRVTEGAEAHVSGRRCCAVDEEKGLCKADLLDQSCFDIWIELLGFNLREHYSIEFAEDCQALCRLDGACECFTWNSIKHICYTKNYTVYPDPLRIYKEEKFTNVPIVNEEQRLAYLAGKSATDVVGVPLELHSKLNNIPLDAAELRRVSLSRVYISGPPVCPGQVIPQKRHRCFLNDTRFYGHDILPMIMGLKSAHACQKMCMTTDQCDTWTYIGTYGSTRCWLKRGIHHSSVEDGWVSGPRDCPVAANLGDDPPDYYPPPNQEEPPVLVYDQLALLKNSDPLDAAQIQQSKKRQESGTNENMAVSGTANTEIKPASEIQPAPWGTHSPGQNSAENQEAPYETST